MTCRDNAKIMELTPKKLNIPPIYSQDGKKLDKLVYSQIFHPYFNRRYWITEYDHETGEGFGLIDDEDGVYWDYIPVGYFQGYGREERCRGVISFAYLPYERDPYFDVQTLESLFLNNSAFRNRYYNSCKFLMTDDQKRVILKLIEEDKGPEPVVEDVMNDTDDGITSLLPDFL